MHNTLMHAKQKKIDLKLKKVPRAVVMPKNTSKYPKDRFTVAYSKNNEMHTVSNLLVATVDCAWFLFVFSNLGYNS